MSLKEDLAQERALAALEGRAFDAASFGRANRPLLEVLVGDADAAKSSKGRASFERDAAGIRDEELRPLLADLLQGGATMREIAAELTRRRVPKCFRRTSPWSAQGVHRILVRLDLAKSERRRERCVCGKQLLLPRARKFCSDLCRSRSHRLERACR